MFSILKDRNKRSVLKALRRIERTKDTVRVEVENTNIGFFSTISLIREMVVIPRPSEIKSEIANGGMVRCKVPWNPSQFFRMPIVASEYKHPWKSYSVLICDWPEKIEGNAQRAHDRFNISRYKNIRLALPEQPPHRVIDLSPGGCKFLISKGYPDFDEGHELSGGKILLGNSVNIFLEQLIPRRIQRFEKVCTVGCQMEIADDGKSPVTLHRLLQSIEHRERTRIVPT